MRDNPASSSGEPRAPLRRPLLKLMFFALPSDQRADRKRCSSAASGKARSGNARTPPSSIVLIARSCDSLASVGRQLATSSVTMSVMSTALTRKLGCAHQEFVDSSCALPALAYRPYDQRLAAAGVSCGEYLRNRCPVVLGIGLDVAASVVFDPELVEHSPVDRMQISHREQDEVGLDLEFAPRHLAQLAVLPLDPACDQRRHLALVTLERLGLDRPVALAPFLVRRRGAQLHRPVRPDQRLVLVLGWLRE